MNDMTLILIAVAAFIVVAVGASFAAGKLFDAIVEERNAKKKEAMFTQDLTAAIIHSKPSWEEVEAMAQVSEVPLSTVVRILGGMRKNILTGKGAELQPNKGDIEGYLRSYKKAEPFAGLPSEIRLHMERVNDALGGNGQLLEPVASHVRDLLALKNRENRIQKRYTIWGFFLAILSILFAVYTYVRPLQSPPSPGDKQVSTPAK